MRSNTVKLDLSMNTRIEKTVYGFIVLLVGFLMLSLMTSCSDSNSPGTARLEVRLTDAPGDFEEVNVDIQDVQVSSEDNGDSGWQSLVINKGVYDLKKLANGIDTLLGSAELPAGKISQIRLVLGTNNTLKIDGQAFPLTTPSAQQSGLKIQVKQEVKEGITYKVLLDFDAALSIVVRGNGEFNLKPVIRSITESLDGAIKGTVQPVDARPAVYAIVGTDTVSTSIDASSGTFMLRGLRPGSYRVVLAPGAGFQLKEIQNVNVAIGEVTDVGVVEIDAM
jgi:hypothetical protein